MTEKRLDHTVYKMGLIFSSRVLTAVLGIVFLPLYIKYLGVESYGLVAFYSTLVGALSLLSTGLGSSVNRELSILSAKGSTPQRLASLLFSVEIFNWFIAIVIGAAIAILSPFIAEYWINVRELSIPVISSCVLIMGLLFCLQMPYSIYEGSMNGLHLQGTFAIINIIFSFIKAIGALLVLHYTGGGIISFFIWQLIASIAFVITVRLVAYKKINPHGEKIYFSWKLLKQIKKFALGITGISLVTFFISQIDKIIVSKFLLLEYVGYYNLAFVLAAVLGMVASPLQTIVLPKFNRLEALSQTDELKKLYYSSSRWMATLVMPLGLMMTAFSEDILLSWTGNVHLSTSTSPILKLVALGYVLNGVASIFYLYTLAKGNTKYGFYQNLFSIMLILPLIFILTKNYGAVGAAACWLIYNAMLLLVSLPVFHSMYLKGGLMHWFKNCFIVPLVVSSVLFLGTKFLLYHYGVSTNIFGLVAILSTLLLIYVLLMKDLRNVILNFIRSQMLSRITGR